MLEDTLDMIRDLLPELRIGIESEDVDEYIRLPAAPGADYRFECSRVNQYDEEFNFVISAVLLPQSEASQARQYFWYRMWETLSIEPVDQLKADFHESLVKMLTYPSRIVQRRTLLFWNFRCETEQDGSWCKVGTNSALRWGFDVPRIAGNRHVYQSPALIASSEP